MFNNNKILYGLVALVFGFAMSFSTVNAQVTGEQETTTQNNFMGKVVDASTGQPLSDVTVQVEGQDKEATTDENGQFTLSNLQAGATGETGEGMGGNTGEITLRIEHEGYQTLTESINPADLGQGQGQGQEGQQGEGNIKTFELEPKEGGGMEGDY